MTKLEQIDQRLSLYHLYLRYYIDFMWPNFPFSITIDASCIPPISSLELMRMYQQTGTMYFYSIRETEKIPELLSYDEWLVENEYADLVA